MSNAGKVSIEVDLITDNIDKEIADVVRQLKSLEKKSEEAVEKNGVIWHGLEKYTEEEIQQYQKLYDKYMQLTDKKMESLNLEREIANVSKSKTVENEKEMKYTEAQLSKINYLTRQLEEMVADYRLMNRADIVNDQDVEDAKELKKDILETVRLLETMTGKKYYIPGITDTKKDLSGIAQATENVIKKVGRWTLAVFGIRSAYMFIRQSMSVLSQYNEKIRADVQYLRFALASALQPVIEKIIELVYKLLAYIGYIARAWFGVELFANASVKAFQKVNKGVKDTNKSAKQLQKTLAGFDEMNILSENGSVASGGGGGGIAGPSMDLSNLDSIEIPGWVQWIGSHKDLLIEALKEIGALILIVFAVKNLVEFTDFITKIGTGLSKLGEILGGMSNLQIFQLILGLALTIWGIIETVRVLTSETIHLEDILNSVSDILIGLGIMMAAFTPWGWVVAGVGLLGNLASKFIDTRSDAEKLTDATNELKEATDRLNQTTNKYVSALDNAEKSQKQLEKLQNDYRISGEELFDAVLIGTKTVDDMTRAELEVYKAYLNNEDAQKKLKEANSELKKAREESVEKSKQEAVAMINATGEYNNYFKAIIKGFENKTKTESEMLSATANIYNQLDDEAKKTFAQNLPDSVKKAIDSHSNFVEVLDDGTEVPLREISKNSKQTFETDVPNSVQKSINKIDSLSKSIDNLKKKGNVNISVKTTTSSSTSGNAKGAIYYPPKLAVGGIINQPGRGVPLAMGGERGAEGVIPLTDAQQMQRLGEAIGKYITVNAQLNNYMNGRLISRELQEVQNEESFAFNGG